LTVVPGVGRAFLTWNENKESDLAGFHVYRSKRSGGDYERLTARPLTRTTLSDETAKQGAVYYYKVTAVDRSGNESAGSEEKMASIEKLR
jgi:fibronectin type 3 domain-containing protein